MWRWLPVREGEYKILLTNRWILQPKLEANLYSKDDVENGIGKGLSEAEFGLRLRYEFSRGSRRMSAMRGHASSATPPTSPKPLARKRTNKVGSPGCASGSDRSCRKPINEQGCFAAALLVF